MIAASASVMLPGRAGVKAATLPATMGIMPAAGPLMVSSELLKKGTKIPPMIAVKMPAIGGQPLAFEMARHSGKAIRKTRNPERMSLLKQLLNPARLPTGIGSAAF